MHIRNPMEWIAGQISSTNVIGSATPQEYWPVSSGGAMPVVRKITVEDVRDAIRRGLDDFAAARTDVIFLCMIYPLIGVLISMAEAHGRLLPLLFPTAAGFALVGPLAAVGLYEMSRQRELTGKISWLDTFKVIRSPSIGAITGLGLLLIGLYFAWLAVAQVIYDFTMGPMPPASARLFIEGMFTTSAGWTMMIAGLAAGTMFGAGVVAISVVSFPLMLDRPVGFSTAIATSVQVLLRNPGPLTVWSLIVAASLFVGALPFFIGLIVVLPVLGHATWHLYRKVVVPPAGMNAINSGRDQETQTSGA
ncbi:hypothetical protein GCM10010909_05190 [Acidocella aquatica]|uniref:DUF2189 domain-containing protein n=1 Tax=Acidocella aquatica TaxID=1922313 RepID=A0ABQ6A066_9PROT|nr:DUF2189 domain-containing protein [Acidocella aquatica]GLR65841.1 hypothetical protein GCM10010909_05190 [Acidocella aquatica]